MDDKTFICDMCKATTQKPYHRLFFRFWNRGKAVYGTDTGSRKRYANLCTSCMERVYGDVFGKEGNDDK